MIITVSGLFVNRESENRFILNLHLYDLHSYFIDKKIEIVERLIGTEQSALTPNPVSDMCVRIEPSLAAGASSIVLHISEKAMAPSLGSSSFR